MIYKEPVLELNLYITHCLFHLWQVYISFVFVDVCLLLKDAYKVGDWLKKLGYRCWVSYRWHCMRNLAGERNIV